MFTAKVKWASLIKFHMSSHSYSSLYTSGNREATTANCTGRSTERSEACNPGRATEETAPPIDTGEGDRFVLQCERARGDDAVSVVFNSVSVNTLDSSIS